MTQKNHAETLIYADWIIPVEPADTIYRDYAIAITNGKITDLLPTQQAQQKYHCQQVFELNGQALIPGLINAHCHSPMNLLKGYADDYKLMDWLENYIWPAEQKWVSRDFVHDGSALAMAEMISAGTTCFADMYFYPEVTAELAQKIGLRAQIGLIVIDFPSAWAKNADQYIEKGLRLHEQSKAWRNITTMFAPHAPYTVAEPILKKIALLSTELNIPVQMHIHETQTEVNAAIQQNGLRPLQQLAELQLLNNKLLAVHMTEVNEEDINSLMQYGGHVVHCPESNLKLASGLCPVAKLLENGINVCLGTDGAASNNDLSMLGEMRTAALLGKMVSRNPESTNAETVLRMATINGAKALGLEQQIGSLSIGKAADIVAIDLRHIATQPVYNPISQIVYATQDSQVSHVWVDGKILLNKGKFCTIEQEQLLQTASYWQEKLMADKN